MLPFSFVAAVFLGLAASACGPESTCEGGCTCITTPAECFGSCVPGYFQRADGTSMFGCGNGNGSVSDSESGVGATSDAATCADDGALAASCDSGAGD